MVYNKQSVDSETMPQMVPSAGYTPPFDYSVFAADSFDLSLLPGGDNDLPLSPSTQLYTQSPPPTKLSSDNPKIYTSFYPDSPENFQNDVELGPDFQKLLAPEEKKDSFTNSTSNNLEVPTNNLYPSSPSSLSSYCSTPDPQLYQQNLISPQYPSSPESSFNLYPNSPADQSFSQIGTNQIYLYPNSPNSTFIKKEDQNTINSFPNSPFQIKEEEFLSPCSQGAASPISSSSYSNHSSPSNHILNEVFLDNSFLDKQIKQESTVDFGELLQNLGPLKELLGDDFKKADEHTSENLKPKTQDYQLLRQVLKDTSFQKKYNLKPFDFGLGTGFVPGNTIKMEEPEVEGELLSTEKIEPVISLAMEQMKKDVSNTCTALGISQDPSRWSSENVKAWIQWTVQQFGLTTVQTDLFDMSGAELATLTEEEFSTRTPQSGSILHAQLEIWKAACLEDDLSMQWTNSNNSSPGDFSDDDDDESVSNQSTSGTKPSGSRNSGSSHIHLWQFLKELLASPAVHGSCIRWLDRGKGVFKIEDSVRVAKLWGKRKNRPAMNYDKLSRSIRQYYKKGIMKKTERSQRLVYQFCHPYCL